MTWRRTAPDALLCVLAVMAAGSVVVAHPAHWPAVAAGSACSLLVLLARRRASLVTSLLAFGLLAVGMSISPTATALQFVGMIATFAVVGTAVRGRRLAVAAAAGLAVLTIATMVIPTGGGSPDLLLSAFICEGALGPGAVLARRAHRIRGLSLEVELAAERERLSTLAALAEERARIARELHDVVSHGLSVIVVQTQAARRAVEDGPDGPVLAHLDAVESSARDALAEMRRMLGLLQLDDTAPAGAPEPPSPGLGDLARLTERARAAGLDLTVELPDRLPAVSAGLGLTVYRVVQESLTNALKYGGGAAWLRVSGDGPWIDVDVLTPARATPTAPVAGGHGLSGMRERVQMYGGRLTAGIERDGRFGVRARLPVSGDDRAATPA